MSMEYLVFSDESGRWNEGDYYLRSWVKISPKNYAVLRKEIVFLKHETGIKELKWNSFKNSLKKAGDTIESIRNLDCCIFITLSIPGHFKDRLDNNKYVILRTLQGIRPEQSTGGEQVTETIKDKIIGAAQHTIFYNFFEKQHIENAKKALVRDIPTQDYKFVIDSPQCLDREWAKIANECGIANITVEKKSETAPGIEFADIIVGCIHGCLQDDGQAMKFYQENLRAKMLDMYSKEFPNPNLIFFQDFSAEQKQKINIFR